MSFYQSIAVYYRFIFPHNPVKTSFVLSLVNRPSAKILDVGCATGDLAIDLASRGHSVWGIDLDEKMIEMAKDAADKKNLPAHFQTNDMLQLKDAFAHQQFDAVLCFGNTLAHLESVEKMQEFFQQVKAVLSADGILAVQLVNYDKVLSKNIERLPDIDNENIRFERKYLREKSSPRIQFKTNLYDKKTNRHIVNQIPLYPVASPELTSLFEATGFVQNKLYGDFKRSPFHTDASALIGVGNHPRL